MPQDLPLDKTPIKDLKNLAEKSALKLSEVDINNYHDLKIAGSVNAFLRLEKLPDFKPGLNFLYAMEAAINNIHWQKISKAEKLQLQLMLEAGREHQKHFTEPDEIQIIQHTKNWVESFIIKYNICPFAGKVVEDNSILFKVVQEADIETCMQQLFDEVLHLIQDESVETTLVIFPKALNDFYDFLEFLAIANTLLEEQSITQEKDLDHSISQGIEQGIEKEVNYTEKEHTVGTSLLNHFQLASFHPEYCFEGENKDSPANFTNRSPWPMIHIIRQSSISKALKYYKDPDRIPEINIARCQKLGYQKLLKIQKSCME